MTWGEWINSEYNNGDLTIGTCDICSSCYIDSEGYYIVSSKNPELALELDTGVYSKTVMIDDYVISEVDSYTYYLEQFSACAPS